MWYLWQSLKTESHVQFGRLIVKINVHILNWIWIKVKISIHTNWYNIKQINQKKIYNLLNFKKLKYCNFIALIIYCLSFKIT